MSTALHKTSGGFATNAQYLDWEFGWVERRARLLASAREDPDDVQALGELNGHLRALHASLCQSRQELVERGEALWVHQWVLQHGLSWFEESVLLVCLAMHLSQQARSALLFAQGNMLKDDVEVGLLVELLQPELGQGELMEVFEPTGALLRSGLVAMAPAAEGSAASLMGRAVYVPHHVAAGAVGRRVLDEALSSCASLTEPQVKPYQMVLPEQVRADVDGFVRLVRMGSAARWVALLCGAPRCGKTMLAQALAQATGQRLLSVNVALLPDTRVARLLPLLFANARIGGAALHLTGVEARAERDPVTVARLGGLIEAHQGMVLLETSDDKALERVLSARPHFVFRLERPGLDERLQLWETLMPYDVALSEDIDMSLLASNYRLSGGQIQDAIEWSVRAAAGGEVDQTLLQAGAQGQLRSNIGEYTEASNVNLRLKDLVLPDKSMAAVEDFLSACRVRHVVMARWGFGRRLATGKGLVALFVGEPGTGKTLCAEIIAAELDRQLHIVSIPKIVSKWVGETEKNLRAVFNQARAQNSLLLFDEADALFTKRVKVERSQDHFRNMETNMLLQEIERYEGIIILTTNLDSNMDPAFARRILFRLHFPTPDAEQRAQIWQRLMPADAPRESDIDFGLLGEDFELTGGQIKNALVRAAYACCARDEPLGEDALRDAAVVQTRAAGRLTREDSF